MTVVHLLDEAARRAGLELVAPERVSKTATAALERRATERGSTVERAAVARKLAESVPLTVDDLRFVAACEQERGLRLALCGGMWGVAWAQRTLSLVEAAAAIQPERRDHGLSLLFGRAAEPEQDEDPERAERTAAWHAWERALRSPAEKQLLAAVQRYLREAGERTAERAEKVLGVRMRLAPEASRAIGEEDLSAILDESGEAVKLREAIGAQVRKVLVRAFALAFKQIAIEGIRWDPTLDPSEQVIGELIVRVQQTTREKVAAAVSEALRIGETIADMQDRIKDLPAFGPARALTVARTESSKLASKGARLAYDQAEALGATLEIEWLSSRDDAVRESHQYLDGKRVRPGESWTFPSGVTTIGPSESGDPSEDINCRCGTRARVLERPKEAA